MAFIVLNIAGERFIPDYTGGNSENAIGLAVLIYAVYFKTVEDRRERKILETTEKKTGLLNENACIAKLDELGRLSKADEYAAVFFDLERFGLVNDRYGRDDAESVRSVLALKPAGYLLKSLPKEKIVAEVDAFFAKKKA